MSNWWQSMSPSARKWVTFYGSVFLLFTLALVMCGVGTVDGDSKRQDDQQEHVQWCNEHPTLCPYGG